MISYILVAHCNHEVLLVIILLYDVYDISISGFIVLKLWYLHFWTFFNALLSLKDGSYTTECSGPWMAEACNWCCWAFSMYRPGDESKFEAKYICSVQSFFSPISPFHNFTFKQVIFCVTFTLRFHWFFYLGKNFKGVN